MLDNNAFLVYLKNSKLYFSPKIKFWQPKGRKMTKQKWRKKFE